MFYLTTIQRFKDETPTAASILGYETQDAAKMAMFSTMASSMANSNVLSVMCMITDENGNVSRTERWTSPDMVVAENV